MRPLRKFAALALVLVPLFGGCGDGNEKKPLPWSLPAAVTGVKPAPIEQLDVPSSVIAWGGADSPEKLSSAAVAIAQQLSPLVPSLLDLVKDQLRAKLALTKIEGIDWGRPARVAVFDPKGMPKEQLAVILTVANKAQLLALLPPAKKENDEGNAITYRDDLGRSICMSFVDDQVVITWDKKQFGANAEFFVKLARATVAEQQTLILSAKNGAALYEKDIDDQIAQAKQQAATSPWAMFGVPPELSAVGLSWMVSVFKELDRVIVVPKLLDDGALLTLTLRPKTDTPTQKSFRSIEARPHTLLGKLPADAVMFASLSANPDAGDGLTARLLERAMFLSLSVPVTEGAEKPTGGEIVFGVHKPLTGDGLTMTTLMSVRDEEKLRSTLRGFFAPFKDKAALDKYKAAGVTIEYKEDAFKIGTVPVDTFDKKEGKENDPYVALGALGDALREFSSRQIAVSKEVALVAHGKDSKKTLEALLNGKLTGGLDKAAGPARALRLGAKDPIGILYISPVELAKRAAIGGKNPLADSLKDLAGTTGVALSLAAHDGELTIVLDLPVEQARNVMQAGTRAQAILQPH